MKVTVLVADGVFDSGVSAVLDVLHSANALSRQMDSPPAGFEIHTVGVQQTVRTGLGHRIDAEPPRAARDADMVVLPALAERDPSRLLGKVASPRLRPIRELLAEARARQIPLASSCTGTFLLAESGVLDGLRATTSWWLSPVFRDRYPKVDLDESRMVTSCDGVTTAGAAFSHLDLALAIVAVQSPALADLVRSYLVIDDRAAQSAYAIPSALTRYDPLVSRFEQWVRDRLDDSVSIAAAAHDLGVSERTLQRTVVRTLGCTPIRLVQNLRVEQATHLLRTTDMSLTAVARTVGYESPSALRILLRDRVGTTVRELRRHS
ncbi:GlxA family transcriptional regulator [Nocardia huaxiensis]|uniref:Helix-turn-helix domain-containing protein n=1 Tax=Nocardia huaxiensis TaxID=2755382 RepID=A0A7D6VA93_9NOCA|nr:helix-turn-helix domain-containing protein [Nocardia huaxiensis]QLY28017.1 helix-turn-helix domain-containing protein [Nocardia huaxiensis]UFS98574.1 helix-turn-helix domain-containing protein [Nocardia huaxiensis]